MTTKAQMVVENQRAMIENARLLESVGKDLSRMPDFKRNTRFHTDRLAARQRLLKQRDELREESRLLSL